MKKLALLFVVSVLVALTLAACGSNGASGGDKVKTIKIGHGAAESLHMHQAWLKFKEELEKDGGFEVEIYPSSQFGNDAEMVESVKTGDLTMATPPSSFLTEEAPNMTLIELPYVFESRENAINTLAGEWGQNQLADLEDNGLVGLGYLENGLRHFTNNKLPVRTPDDLKGLKLRTMQVPAHVYLWNDLGATAEGAPFAEVYNNLSSGRFDGQENPIGLIYSQKFYEVQKYLTLTGHVYTAYVPVMNSDFWNELTEEEQTVIKDAFKVAYDYQLELIEKEETEQLEEIKGDDQYPTEIIELTDEEKQAFMDAAKPTLDHFREEIGADAFDEFIEAIEAAK
ncbi:TRAP transporter substrate-binding protein [Ferdinandcohnia sp. SAFN-114]|uniref:TRAP transporter substrate-binding protein n=1 Tax=Ferdinandcohnia sp. SAFN-114 TaxID=3387275 RepID=UPI003F7F6336